VTASLWGSSTATFASPAVIIPSGVDATYTTPTIDADALDNDMLCKSAEFGQDALELFAFVRRLDNDPYAGSVRGTRGTLWGEAGNSVDKSSLLIAMLRAAGMPAMGITPGRMRMAKQPHLLSAECGCISALPPTRHPGKLRWGLLFIWPVKFEHQRMVLLYRHWFRFIWFDTQ